MCDTRYFEVEIASPSLREWLAMTFFHFFAFQAVGYATLHRPISAAYPSLDSSLRWNDKIFVKIIPNVLP
jgi:hypothetical protein